MHVQAGRLQTVDMYNVRSCVATIMEKKESRCLRYSAVLSEYMGSTSNCRCEELFSEALLSIDNPWTNVRAFDASTTPVSYTHLTLPTTPYV